MVAVVGLSLMAVIPDGTTVRLAVPVMPCASTVIVALLLCHSLVDYPLRTTALGAVFALFCGILAAPIAASRLESPKPHRHSERPKIELPPAPLRSDDFVWPGSWQRKDGVRRGSPEPWL